MNETTIPTTNGDLLSVLTREGVLIHVSVRYWRAAKRLKAEDLGLDPDKVSERLVSLGHKRLLPKEATSRLALVESRAHALIDGCTFPFLGGIGHFLPNAKLPSVREKLSELQAAFEEARDAFLDHYETHRADALVEWVEMANRLTDDPERLVAVIRQSFPLRDKVAEKFAFEVRLFQLAIPEELSTSLVSYGEQLEVVAARRQAAQQARDEIRSGVQSFVAECVTTLREQTAVLCEEMLASMQSGKTEGVHKKTLNRLRRFIDHFGELNFADDSVMAQQLEQIRHQYLNRSAEEYRENPIAQQSLAEGLTRMRDFARDLSQQDARELVERFGQMGHRKLQLAS